MNEDFGFVRPSPGAHMSQIPDPARKALRDWGIIKDSIQVRPLNRADLERLVKEIGEGKPCRIDLSGADMRGIDIRGMALSKAILGGCNLEGAIAMPMVTSATGDLSPGDLSYESALAQWHDGKPPDWVKSIQPTSLDGSLLGLANLSYSDFRWAVLTGTNMTRCRLNGADLSRADLSNSNLDWARLDEGTLQSTVLLGTSLKSARIIDVDLSNAILEDANLTGAFISPGTRLESVRWGKDYINSIEREGDYQAAITLYRQLMDWHEQAGLRNTASKFHYRARESQRKAQLKSLTDEFSGFRRNLAQAWNSLKGGGNNS